MAASLVVSTQYRVPYADSDQMGVVYYANYFVYFERARSELLRAVNYTYVQMERDGLALPVLEAHCAYRKSAHYDDLLEISARYEVISPTRIKVACEVKRDGVLLAEGYTVHACLSLSTRKPVPLPALFQQAAAP